MTNPLAWLFVLGLFAWFSRKRSRWFFAANVFCAVMIVIALSPPVTLFLSQRWEAEFSRAHDCQSMLPDVLVLLPGGVERSSGNPEFSVLTHKSLIRLQQALSVSVGNGGVPILVSGTSFEALVLRTVAEQWGQSDLLVDLTGPQNTMQAAKAASLHPSLTDSNVWLVTSAIHMRRSVTAFQHYGVEVCPIGVDQNERSRGFLPDFRSVQRLDSLLHEVIGLLYYRIRFWFE